ncbi:hypothetical protein M0805_003834 [Coniferiporia weirii]|nr:hypothetical protein M0805_003834 [Coniferiporia weirii]
MSKSSSSSAAKTASLPHKSAWAKGPPQNASAASSPRSQSPAPIAQTQSHSRRSSQLGSFKDAVGVGIASGPRSGVPPSKAGNTISFGTVNGAVNDKSTPPSSPAQTPPVAKPESRPVQSFGSIEATATTNGKSSLTPASSISSAVSTSSAASTANTTPVSTPLRTKVDVSALFRGGGSSTKTSSPVTSTFAESIASPPMRSSTLSPAVPPPQSQNAPGPAGPSLHGHAHPHQPPQQQYPPPFVPTAMRNQNVGGGPRSPSFPRQMPNGAAGRPPVANGPPGANGSNMPSPRLGPPSHQLHPHNQHQPAPVPGMQPQMQPVAWGGGYYYSYLPGMPPVQGVPGQEHYMQYPPQTWMHAQQVPHQGGPGMNGPPQTPHAHGHGLPVSPRQPPPPLQPPGTPPAGVASSLPSAGPRLNTNASAFIPGQVAQLPPQLQQRQNKIKITDASGHEVDLNGLRKQGGTPSTPTTPAMDKQNRRTMVRMETEEARLKRIAEEKAKRDEEARIQKVKEEEERRKKEAVEEVERKRKEEEERVKKAEEEKKRKEEELELERIRKEEERVKREEEEERKRKEEEEERLRKEEEEKEKERLRKEDEERLRKEDEERQRKEDEEMEKERLRKEKEEEEAKAREVEKARAGLEIRSKKEGEAASNIIDTPLSASPESHKRRPIPGPLDLSSTHKPVPQALPSALATARLIQDVYQVQYPEGIKSPKPELNTNAKDGKFRYDRDFLLQFMSVCKEKPDNLPPLEAIGLEPSDQSHSMGRGGSGRRGVSGGMGPPMSTAARQASVGLGLGGLNGFGKSASSFAAMGSFSAPNKLSSEERFNRSSSMSGGPGGFGIASGRSSPMVRSSSQGGPGSMGSGPMGNKRTRSKRGEARNDSNRIGSSASQFNAAGTGLLEPVAPLETSANRWVAGSTKRAVPVDMDAPEVVDRKVRSLLNKLTMEKFESISTQIISWANKSESEKDGRTLIQVIRLVFEKATDEATWSEMYARLCRKMMEQISPNVQDDGIRNAEGKPITGGLLFRKYLLNRCQEDFERGWAAKDSTAAAAKAKASEDQAVKDANEKDENKEAGESALYSEEYYAAQKAKRQGLGLVKFIGELFKLQMLTERIMHECIKKLLSNVDNPEEEEIESLCKLLTTVGQSLDTSKARGHMDVYFSRMKELAKSNNVSSRMQFMLLDIIELRSRGWSARNLVAAPSTLAQIHEAAAKEKVQQEKDSLARSMGMSRGGSRRGHDRDGNAQQVGPDGWAVASGPSRPVSKAGDLSNFGKITKGGTMTFGPSSVFNAKRDGSGKRDSAQLSRTNSSSNMFSMLNSEAAAEAVPVPSSRPSRPPSRGASVDLSHGAPSEPTQRPKLNLLPRTMPVPEKEELPSSEQADADEAEDGEVAESSAAAKPSMTKEQATKKIEQDSKEFFAIRNLDEAEEYFTALPAEHRHMLVEKLVMHAIESKQADAQLVADVFERALALNLCSPASFEDGFVPTAEILDDIAIDAPKAFDLMATMMKGAKLDEERRARVASKSMDSDKLLSLLA